MKHLEYKSESKDGIAFLLVFFASLIAYIFFGSLGTVGYTTLFIKIGCAIGLITGFFAIGINRDMDRIEYYSNRVEYLINNFNDISLSEVIDEYSEIKTKTKNNKLFILYGMIKQKQNESEL